jgi:protein MBA1
MKSRDFLTLLVYKYQNKPRLKLKLRQTAPAAVGLHRGMYTAFAEGNAQELKKMCAEGLMANFQARLLARPKGEKWVWEVIKYTKRPRVMSHRGASLGIEGVGIRQAVVRISSRQKLTRYKADGTMIPTTGKEKDVTEYVVIQRMLKDYVEGDWIAWGTTEETTYEMWEEQLREELGD